jgi:hypothetical protein
MKIRYFIFIVCLLVTAKITAQPKIYMVGKVVDFDQKKPIKGARAYNMNAKAGSVTGANGLFFIWASVGDSVRLSANGYVSRTIFCQKQSTDSSYYLFTDPTFVTQLDEVVVEGKRIEQMKREINDLLLEAPETNKFDYSKLLSTSNSPNTMGAGISITAIYDYFSKQGKDHRHAEILVQQNRYKYYADWRINSKLVSRLTGLVGTDLERFMGSLNLDPLYVLRATDYELNASIIQHYERWKNKLSNE